MVQTSTKARGCCQKTNFTPIARGSRVFRLFARIVKGLTPGLGETLTLNWDVEFWHAGHYRSIGAAAHLRFNEDNVHKQSGEQNVYKSGNIEAYRKNLIKKIGLERVEAPDRDWETKHPNSG